MPRLLLATTNRGKADEYRSLLREVDFDLITLDQAGISQEAEENYDTFEDNARSKAAFYAALSGLITLADDSGLEVEYLNGEPGVYSARFSGKGATCKSNNEKLLRLLKDVPAAKRKACFKCVIAVVDKGKVIEVVEGVCRGKICLASKGDNGFGYDPVFVPDGYKKTFAQMGPVLKNKISHRSKALAKAKNIISKYLSLCL